MKSTPKIALVALIAAALLASGGCSADPSQAIPKSEPSFKPVFKTDAEALAAAEKDYAGYLSTAAAITASANPEPSLMSEWATPRQTKSLIKSFASLTDAHEHQTGEERTTHFSLQRIDQTHTGRVYLTAYICLDKSAIKEFDQSGKDVTPTEGEDIFTIVVRFANAGPNSNAMLVDGSDAWSGHSYC